MKKADVYKRQVNAGISIADIDCPARDALKEIYEKVSIMLKLEQKGSKKL